MVRHICALILFFFSLTLHAQQKKVRVALVGFYNLENLFDTVHAEGKNDYDFTPTGLYKYDGSIYRQKLDLLAEAISRIGADVTPDGLALFGVAEIENGTVLQDLAQTEKLKSRNYRHVHIEGPDERGIDVGLMYNPKYFRVLSQQSLFVQLPPNGKDAYYTRDVLYVKGVLAGDTVHVFVNHWPSRRGGEERSQSSRAAAAKVGKIRIDSILAENPGAKILTMGDLNDDPVSPSVTDVLGAKGKIEDVGPTDLYNPWMQFYKKGIGTLAYQDSWGLFDQIILSGSWLNKSQKGFYYQKATLFNEGFLIQKTGKFRGYPKRTWDGPTFNYGYSDHFPVYITLFKNLE
jgi:hypothetical protein